METRCAAGDLAGINSAGDPTDRPGRSGPSRPRLSRQMAWPTAWLVATGWLAAWATSDLAHAGPVTRGEVIEMARSYVGHTWRAEPVNVRHGRDSAGIEVQTSDGSGDSPGGQWRSGAANTGVPYKWGGFDSLASFRAGVAAGKAAGDLYSAEKRRLGDKAVSADAVGIDCSGFVSRCWKLGRKFGTATLPSICRPLRSPAELRPGDIMNVSGGHVMLFSRWVDDARGQAEFFEADPASKVRIASYGVGALSERGFRPLRYRRIAD